MYTFISPISIYIYIHIFQFSSGHCRGSFIIRKPENSLLPQWPRHVHTDFIVSGLKSLNYEKLILAKNTFSPCGRLAHVLTSPFVCAVCPFLDWPNTTATAKAFLTASWSVCTMIRRRVRTLATLYNLLWFFLPPRDSSPFTFPPFSLPHFFFFFGLLILAELYLIKQFALGWH